MSFNIFIKGWENSALQITRHFLFPFCLFVFLTDSTLKSCNSSLHLYPSRGVLKYKILKLMFGRYRFMKMKLIYIYIYMEYMYPDWYCSQIMLQAALHALGNISGETRSENKIMLNNDAEESLQHLIYESASKSPKLTPSVNSFYFSFYCSFLVSLH